MKKTNIPLILGSIILLLILFIMIFPDMFTDNSPYTIQIVRFIHEDGKLFVERSPFNPGSDFILGSDDLGRDILSYIIYGTRLTITLGLLIAIGQFLIAIPLALLGGFGNRLAKSVIQQFNIIFSAIPALLISIILLKLDFIADLDKQSSIIAFVLILTAVSWPKLGSLIMERVEAIIAQPFIKGEVAIGKRRAKIALENVVPHLAPELIILFFMEIARNLSMIMQLGIFAVFVGNLGIVDDQGSGFYINTDISFEPEWASMLSTSRTLISTAPWAVIFPALAFFISVLGFNLFGEGLRNIIQKPDSRMPLVSRKLISLDFSYLWRMIGKKEKIKYSVGTFTLIALFLIFSIVNKEDYTFSLAADSIDLPNRVIIGTEEADETIQQIIDKMVQLGIEPLKEEGYALSYDIGPSYMLKDQDFSISLEDGPMDLIPNQDFAFVTSGDINNTGRIHDATEIDMFSIDDYSKFKDKFILIDKEYYNDQAIDYFIKEINKNERVKGVLLIARKSERINSIIIDENEKMSVIMVSREVSDLLKTNMDSTISISSSVIPLESRGYNIVGMQKGTDENIGDEAIVIGMNYNYTEDGENDVLEFNLELMEQLCQQEGNKRSIIFMFLDGTIDEKRHGAHYITQDFPYSPNKVEGYIDLTGLVERNFDHIQYSAAQAPITRPFAWSLGHHIEQEFTKNNLEIREIQTRHIGNEYYFTDSQADNAMFWEKGIPTIIINTLESGEQTRSIEEVGSILLKVINKNNY
ncbi:ABC transporter permease subunit [Gudongella sp. DL1XJH-153]|uniref:ABC transporter permease subunit n=1 Tax=Gudongella sp. DL1XJH-153 TaxID=3409804 RepID=UPI003BB6B537